MGLPLERLTVLAQDAGTSTLLQFAPLIVIGLLFWFLIMRPQRQEQSKRQDMLRSVKKNDHVLTTGGIYGVVTSVRPDVDEITVKVDETSNTKLRMTLSSIARVIQDQSAGESASP